MTVAETLEVWMTVEILIWITKILRGIETWKSM
jgi:hypothetical protein